MTTDVRREVAPDHPGLAGLDAYARAHATGEPPPAFAPSLPDYGAQQRASDEAAMRNVEPRRPLRVPEPVALALPDVRHARNLLGGVVTAAALTGLHRALAATAHGLSGAKRRKVEKALADLHEALTW